MCFPSFCNPLEVLSELFRNAHFRQLNQTTSHLADDRRVRGTALPVEQGDCIGGNEPLEEFRTVHGNGSRLGYRPGTEIIAYAGSNTRLRESATSCLRGLWYGHTKEGERGTR